MLSMHLPIMIVWSKECMENRNQRKYNLKLCCWSETIKILGESGTTSAAELSIFIYEIREKLYI